MCGTLFAYIKVIQQLNIWDTRPFSFYMETKYYIPSNGTEGMMFTSEFCDKCYKESSCTILLKAMCGDMPKQWIYNPNPTCTSFNPTRPKSKKKRPVGMETMF